MNIETSRGNVRSRWSAKGFVKKNHVDETQERLESTSMKVNNQKPNMSMARPIEVLVNGVASGDDNLFVCTAGRIFDVMTDLL